MAAAAAEVAVWANPPFVSVMIRDPVNRIPIEIFMLGLTKGFSSFLGSRQDSPVRETTA